MIFGGVVEETLEPQKKFLDEFQEEVLGESLEESIGERLSLPCGIRTLSSLRALTYKD